MQDLAVACSEVSIAFGERRVLDSLNIELPPGRHVAIMGPSGSGKTTLLHLLAGIIEPDAGKVSVAGLDLVRASSRARAKHRQHNVAMVFQFGELLPELSVGENVALPLLMRGERPSSGLVESVLSSVGLNNADAWPAQLSGGETQRVAVARALVTGPKIILCDEPTGALDATRSAQVVDLLKKTSTQTGATLVVSTHDQSVAQEMDEIFDLADGRLMGRRQ